MVMSVIGVRSALLIGFLVACGLPLAAFWLWPHAEARDSEMAELRERHRLIADTLAASLDRYQADVRLLFRSIAPQVARGEPTAFARDLLVARHFRHVCVADPRDGRVVRAFLTERAPCPEVIPADRMAMFRAMASGGQPPLSKVMKPDDGGPPRLFIATEAEGFLVVAAVGLQRFRDLAGAVAFGSGGHAAILDATGRVIAHPLPSWVETSWSMAKIAPVRRALEGERGVSTFESPALGETVLAAFAPVPGTGWAVVVPQPLGPIAARQAAETRATAIIFLSGLVLSAVLALVLSGRVAQGVRRVSDAARRVAEGEDGVRVPPSGGPLAFAELDGLAKSFNVMAGRVERARERIEAMARADPLTGLLNRGAFIQVAEGALAAASPDEGRTLFFIDVDRLKAVNDGFGHVMGDTLLRTLAARLFMAAPPGSLAARQGGDEFLLLAPGDDPDVCAALGGRLLSALSQPIELEGRRFLMSCSIGASFWPRDARDLTRLISCADRAMYEAKISGRNGLRLFDAALRDRIAEDERLKRDLQDALAVGALTAAFQPVLDARDGRLVGFEALARWRCGDVSVPAERFVRLAEEAGLIGELGRQMRRHAFAFGAALQRRGCRAPVAVNVSESELFNLGFVDDLLAALAEADLPAAGVVVEITESLFEQDGETVSRALGALRRAGLSLALDDFGKGHASLRRLQTYPVDRLKIDLSFFGDVATDPRAQAMVRSLIGLGRNLDLAITVEGVETAAHEDFVAALDIDEVQGFWRHRPLDVDAALALADRDLAARRAQRA
jgi:diguanylate cyclase (GGDEF)-like protein